MHGATGTCEPCWGRTLDEHVTPGQHGQIRPAAEVGCRFGYTEHHVSFALLYLALLGCCLHFAWHIPWPVRGLTGGCYIFNATLHALLGGVCWSPSILAAAHNPPPTFPLVRLGFSHRVINSLVAAAVAAHVVRLTASSDAVRTVKLMVLSVLALVNAALQGWWWTHDLNENTVPLLLFPGLLLSGTSIIFIFSATRSHAMLANLCTLPVVAITVTVVCSKSEDELTCEIEREAGVQRLLTQPTSSI